MAADKIILHEVHFMPLRSQSNIYGSLNLCIDGSNKLVVTTLRGEVHCLEFYDPLVQRPPSFKSIAFSYIPGVKINVGLHFNIRTYFFPQLVLKWYPLMQ